MFLEGLYNLSPVSENIFTIPAVYITPRLSELFTIQRLMKNKRALRVPVKSPASAFSYRQ